MSHLLRPKNSNGRRRERRTKYIGESVKAFLVLDRDAMTLACTCPYKFGEKDNKAVDCVILT